MFKDSVQASHGLQAISRYKAHLTLVCYRCVPDHERHTQYTRRSVLTLFDLVCLDSASLLSAAFGDCLPGCCDGGTFAGLSIMRAIARV